MKKIIVSISLFLMFSNAYSYNSNSLLFFRKSIVEITGTTKKCTVITDFKSNSDVYMFGLSDSSVKILKNNISEEILIKDIRSIKFSGSGFWTGAAVGAGIAFGFGLATGNEFGSDQYEIEGALFVGFVLSVPLALAGGGIGHLIAEDKIYDLSNLDFEAKRKKVKYLIKEYSDS